MARRPEHELPPELYYSEEEAKKYSTSSRLWEIQEKMTERALELLGLPEGPCFLLDLGCGSGMSGTVLEENGHVWVGLDISKPMLDVAREHPVEGDLILSDLGAGLPFRAGKFDGAVSISALQWLCNADKKINNPVKRLRKFFTSLYGCLDRGARAVFQFYPENADQIELVTRESAAAGFRGGIVIDYPNSTKAKKYFLVLDVSGSQRSAPKALGEGSDMQTGVVFGTRKEKSKRGKRGVEVKRYDWIKEVKEKRRRQGKETRADTKYTARKRSGRF